MRETVKLFRSRDGGLTYEVPVNAGQANGNIVLSSDRNAHTIEGPGFFRIEKSKTVVASAIHVDT